MPSIQHFISADPNQRLQIYANDHYAAYAATVALGQRCAEANPDNPLGDYLRGIFIPQTEDEKARLADYGSAVGMHQNRLKVIGARIAEYTGRSKTNGQLVGYSPLSRIVEIEGLLASSAYKLSFWSTVASLPSPPDYDAADAPELADRIEDQIASLRRLRSGHLAETFATEDLH